MPDLTPVFGPDWTSHHFADWQRWLGHLAGQPVCGLEIGSFEGRSAVWFLTHVLTHRDSRLICIDPWDYDEERSIVPGGATRIAEQFDWRATHRRFAANTAPYADRLQVWAMSSRWAVPALYPDTPLSFAYIDGSHLAARVLEDAVLVWPRLVSGGILIFDDYRWQQAKPPPAGWPEEVMRPQPGIDAFLRVYAAQYACVQHSNDQVMVVKS